MLFNFNIIPATIKALTKFVQVLDQHPRGARMLIAVMLTTGGLVMLPQLPAVLQQPEPSPGITSAPR